jgi:hypothetical protein
MQLKTETTSNDNGNSEIGSSRYEVIAQRAYELWMLRGSPEGSPEVDWEQAEMELQGAEPLASGAGGA